MVATVPSGIIPQQGEEGYSFGMPDGVDLSAMPGGLGSTAMQLARGVQPFPVRLLLTRLQFYVWMLFFHHIIKKGTLSFLMPLDSGQGITNHLCNMLPDTHAVRYMNYNAWEVTFTVEAEASIYA